MGRGNQRCVLCGEQVYGTTTLTTLEGDSDCPAPYWIVKLGDRALANFFQEKDGLSPAERAAKYAKDRSNKRVKLTALQLSPHGHMPR